MKQRLRKQQKISMKLKILWKDKIDQPLPHQSFQWKVRVDYQKWNWKWSRSVVSDSLQPLQAPPSMGFSRHEYWNGLPFPSPGDLLDLGIEPTSLASPALQADSLLLSHQGSPWRWQISVLLIINLLLLIDLRSCIYELTGVYIFINCFQAKI